jgi:hypothetical protein
MSTKNDGARFFDDVNDGAPNTIKSIVFQKMTFIKPSKIKVFTRAPYKHRTSTVLAPEKHGTSPAGTLLPITYYLLPSTLSPLTPKR